MDAILLMIVAGMGSATLAGVHALFKIQLDRERRMRALAAVAEAAGLSDVVTSNPPLGPVSVRGRFGRTRVVVSQRGAGSKTASTHITVRSSKRRGGSFVLRTEDAAWADERAGEIEVGDEPFDAAFCVSGDDPRLLAWLDAPTRELLLSLYTDADVSIDRNRVDASLRAGARADLESILDRAIRLARRLDQGTVVPQLARNATTDPSPAVRLRNLQTLIQAFEQRKETAGALHTALGDKDPAVRLAAALALGDKGQRVLRTLAESLVDDRCAAEAIDALGRRLPRATVDDILDRALAAGFVQAARACVEHLGAVGDAAAVARVARVLVEAEGDLAVTAATALGKGGPEAEGALLAALARGRAPLRLAAAAALGHVGTAAAVPPLRDAEDHAADAALARAARQAVVEIQGRLGGVSPGRVSLADTDAGRLSVAGGEPGQVSLPGEPGKLSLNGGGDEE